MECSTRPLVEHLVDEPGTVGLRRRESSLKTRETGASAWVHEGMVIVRDIKLLSVGEHHMLPIFGKVHIGYLPDGHFVDPSTLPRLVEALSREVRLQEVLTRRIAEELDELLYSSGLAVMIEAVHLRMMNDGEGKGPSTITSTFLGAFAGDPWIRAEFMRIIRRK